MICDDKQILSFHVSRAEVTANESNVIECAQMDFATTGSWQGHSNPSKHKGLPLFEGYKVPV